MKLKAVYEAQDAIPAGFEELYTERDGQWELTGVEGVKTDGDVARLKTSLQNERAAHKATKEKVRPILSMLNDDFTVEDVVERLDSYEDLKHRAEATGDDKIEEVLEKRLEGKLRPVQRTLKEREEQLAAANERLAAFESKEKHRLITDELRRVAKKNGVLDPAIEDIFMYAGKFDVAEDGTVVTKDDQVTADIWLSDMQPKRPNWWGNTGGAGAGGDGGKGGGANNPWSKEHWNTTDQMKLVREQGREKAEQYAARYGAKIGQSFEQVHKK